MRAGWGLVGLALLLIGCSSSPVPAAVSQLPASTTEPRDRVPPSVAPFTTVAVPTPEPPETEPDPTTTTEGEPLSLSVALPPEGVAIEDGGDVVLVTLSGTEVTRIAGARLSHPLPPGPQAIVKGDRFYVIEGDRTSLRQTNQVPLTDGATIEVDSGLVRHGGDEIGLGQPYTVSGHRESVTWHEDGVTPLVFHIATGELTELDGCVEVETGYRACGDEIQRDDGTVAAVVPYVTTAVLSPDRDRLLVGSVPAGGTPFVFITPATAGSPDPTRSVRFPGRALGWSADGRAVALLPDSVSFIRPDGSSTPIRAVSGPTQAAMWESVGG